MLVQIDIKRNEALSYEKALESTSDLKRHKNAGSENYFY